MATYCEECKRGRLGYCEDCKRNYCLCDRCDYCSNCGEHK